MTKERAYELIDKLLKAQEVANGLLLDINTDELKELKQLTKTVFTSADKISVSTPEGELVAYPGTDPEYPAICTMLIPSETDSEIDTATVEFHPDTGIRMIVWGNAMDEDYTHIETLTNLSECREQMKDDEEQEG